MGNGTFESSSMDSARRLVDGITTNASDSDSSSDDSTICDNSGTPEIAAFIIGACQAISESQSFIITCTGTHDASISMFMNNECSGTAAATTGDVNGFAGDCASMIACNAVAGQTDQDSAPIYTVIAPLLIAFVALLNA